MNWDEFWDNHSCEWDICPTCQGKIRQLIEERNQWLYREAETERLREENERLKLELGQAHENFANQGESYEELAEENERLKEDLETVEGGHDLAAESVVRLRHELVELQARLSVAEDIIRDLPDHSDLDAAQFKVNELTTRLSAAEEKLLTHEGREEHFRRAEAVVEAAKEHLRGSHRTDGAYDLSDAIRRWEEGAVTPGESLRPNAPG